MTRGKLADTPSNLPDMSEKNLQVSTEGRIAIITIARETRLNALNLETITALSETISRLGRDSGTRAIVIAGAGTRAFAAGADIEEIRQLDPLAAREFSASGQRLMRLIETLQGIIRGLTGVTPPGESRSSRTM